MTDNNRHTERFCPGCGTETLIVDLVRGAQTFCHWEPLRPELGERPPHWLRQEDGFS